MIPRYSVSEIETIWSEQNRFEKMLEVELALLKGLESFKVIPENTTDAFHRVKVNPRRIQEIEIETRHDVIAFCTSITEQVPSESGRFFHYGVTSSDILDTALSLQLKDSIRIILSDLEALIKTLESRVTETQDLLCLGRSHGMAAEPMVFAQKFLSHQSELKRRLRDYQHLLNHELTGQISGAVGNYTVLTPEIEAKTLELLQLPIEPCSTQVIPRDRLGLIISVGALTASALERMSVEFRLLHHSDIGEIHEGFRKGQKGSSTMPHKKNPVSSENLTGLARVIRSHLDIALENIVLWHERDISHSSTERLYLPDHFGLLSYSLRRMNETVRDLVIHREIIESKVKEHFTCLSSLVLHRLIDQNPTAREKLYGIVQEASFKARSLDEWLEAIQSEISINGLSPLKKKLDWPEIRQHYLMSFKRKS